MALEPGDWIRIARRESRHVRWHGQSVDPDDIEGAICERLARDQPADVALAVTIAQGAAVDFVRKWNLDGGVLRDDDRGDVLRERQALDVAGERERVFAMLVLLEARELLVCAWRVAGYSDERIGVALGLSAQRVGQIRRSVAFVLGARFR